MADGFKIICNSCEREDLITSSMSHGHLEKSNIQMDIELGEDSLEDTELNISCAQCGSSVRMWYL